MQLLEVGQNGCRRICFYQEPPLDRQCCWSLPSGASHTQPALDLDLSSKALVFLQGQLFWSDFWVGVKLVQVGRCAMGRLLVGAIEWIRIH